MTGEVPSHLGQRIPQDSMSAVPVEGFPARKNINNISVQTGEEFSVEFLQERPTPIKVPGRPDWNHHGYANRVGSNFNQNHNPGCEDRTGILELKRTESECSSDVSDVTSGKGRVLGAVEKSCMDKSIKAYKEGKVQGVSGKMNSEQAVVGQIAQTSGFPSDYPHGFHPHQVPGTPDGFQSGKMKFLCSFGGRILPRPSDGKLRYVGGETRIITIRKNVSWKELMQKTFGICNQPHTIKYQLPGEDLDALISVSSDEDLQNMIEEYYGIERFEGSQRLRIFLISLSESENCSFAPNDAQSNSEYHYVVAVNGALDQNLQKSSSAQNLLGHNLDGTPRFQKDLPQLRRLDLKDITSPTNLARKFGDLTSQFFAASQNSSYSPPQSPPFSPLPARIMDSKNALKQSYENRLYRVGSDNALLLSDPLSDDSCVIYHGHRLHGDMAYKHLGVDQLNKLREVHCHNHMPSRDFALMYAFSNSDLSEYSACEKSLLTDRLFHSERSQRHQEESLSQLSESNDSHHGMIHALSDSQLQEHGGKHVDCLQEKSQPSSVFSAISRSPVNKNDLQVGQVESQKGIELMDSTSQTKLLKTMVAHPITHHIDEKYKAEKTDEPNIRLRRHYDERQFNPEVTRVVEKDVPVHRGAKHDSDIHGSPSAGKYRSKKLGIVNHPADTHNFHFSPKPLQSSESIISSTPVSEACPNVLKEHYPHIHDDEISSEIPVSERTAKDQQHDAYEPSKNDPSAEGGTVTASLPSFPWPLTCPYVPIPDMVPVNNRDHQYDDECSSTATFSGPPVDLVSQVSPCLVSVTRNDMIHKLEAGFVNPVNSSLPTSNIGVGLSLKLNTNEPTLQSLLQNPVLDEAIQREVPILYQDSVNYEKNKEADQEECSYGPSKGEGDILVHVGSQNDFHEQIQQKTVILVEDVTDSVTSGIHSQNGDPRSPKVTEVESITSDSESEEVRHDDRDVDDFSDAAIAEMEASIYGLQIIKNADLEELRELGSGTFGTVYHGKWRGTDVAIKRIKKSCFSGRTSEQERLTKDFWREAQILSKLHHPNVVAFYGVVPDGAGGTLATVTEFMVNGSLRHVLLKKDRALDRRKRLIIAMDAAFGMEYLHSKNIVHFDLKCDNLLVNLRDSQRPICKVGDFGLSRIKRNTLVSGGVRGTLPWMAPELLNGSSSRVSEKVDVFSFGIAMWEIHTGEEPYANMHCGAIIGGIVNNTLRPPIPDRCDPEWRKLMEECWSPDPAARPSFTEITSRLRIMSMKLQSKVKSSINR